MKKVLLMLFLAVLLVGCDKLKGEKGDPGEQGVPGDDATASTYEGSITSDHVTISIQELKKDEMPIVTVYVSDGSGEWLEIPCYNYLANNNVLAMISYGKIEIYNAYSGGQREYYIIVAAYPHAPKLDRIL